MAEIILAIVLLLIAATAARMITQYKALRKSVTVSSADDPQLFRCSAELVNEIRNDGQQIDFVISMRGKIQCPSQMHDTDVQILMGDVTSGLNQAPPVV